MKTIEALTPEEIHARLKESPEWRLIAGELVRSVDFSSYLEGLEFVERVAKEAEKNDHHPLIVLDYKKVVVKYSTHSVHGITALDFRMAGVVESLISKK